MGPLPNEAPPEESEPAQGHDNKKCPSPNKKQTSICLVESGQMSPARTNQEGKATGSSCSSVEEHGGREEQDSKPSLMTTSSVALIGSSPNEEVDQEEEEATPREIPSGWTRVKLEPDC